MNFRAEHGLLLMLAIARPSRIPTEAGLSLMPADGGLSLVPAEAEFCKGPKPPLAKVAEGLRLSSAEAHNPPGRPPRSSATARGQLRQRSSWRLCRRPFGQTDLCRGDLRPPACASYSCHSRTINSTTDFSSSFCTPISSSSNFQNQDDL
ncbi:hypothetical protein L596_027908 [Steinernema carpocapsae]|uniref:Uncharacterized protein n=1 Tax=Steinernema carpocapsae TaxID=34508 RepID=A0A4U5LX00_STECR|nr:hypothetical protein L596_027908 [Steinernema carpocapsae]